MDVISSLSESIRTGFIDHSISSQLAYRPEFLTNDATQGKKVLTSILKELQECDEFWFSVAFITTGGVATIMNALIELEERNIQGKILASQYLNFTQPEALRRIRKFSGVDLHIATEGDFHSKGYLFRKGGIYSLIVGSSNLTQTALCTNIEWNIKVSASQESELVKKTKLEFNKEFDRAVVVTHEFIQDYQNVYDWYRQRSIQLKERSQELGILKIRPNHMQAEALLNLEKLRAEGKNKALLISATGTGKTYLSAFHVQKCNPRKFLFIVHRRTIAEKALRSFKNILGSSIKTGLYSGFNRDTEADYIFATVQTISKQEHLEKFSPDHFDYIVIDETHRAGAPSYKRIMDYFKPKFLLGMTATPERTDGYNVFELFDHNIAYEIRLHSALSEDMLSPFHYYGVTDLTINEEEIDDKTDFNLLTAKERIDRIVEKAELYGCDDGVIRGLIFCSRKEECRILSDAFNVKGYCTIALTGDSSEEERAKAIRRLESKDEIEKLDYIFTVDIFNEGVDIPKVNQIIMLRPTQSAIIFVQQLGRGLRKAKAKDYLTVIDFIGNYSNNYLVPIALYGDTTYNKDALRKVVSGGSRMIPGASTINFDRISRNKIFESIDSASMQLKKDLVNDYKLLKFKLGHIPMMVDFLEHGSRDPQLYVNYAGSYYEFVNSVEDSIVPKLTTRSRDFLKYFSKEINNTKRVVESYLLQSLLASHVIEVEEWKKDFLLSYHFHLTEATLDSCIRNLNFGFVTERLDGQMVTVGEKYDFKVVRREKGKIGLEADFQLQLQNEQFMKFLIDSTKYAITTYDAIYSRTAFYEGFLLYQKYSRKDVFRILNWPQNPVAQNVGGYMASKDGSNCPIFVNYHKEEDISNTTKYDDGFVSPYEFKWMSKSKRKLESKDVQLISSGKARLPLFIKKSNGESGDFYYMGDVEPIEDKTIQTTMEDRNGKKVPVVKMLFRMKTPAQDEIYNYLRNKH